MTFTNENFIEYKRMITRYKIDDKYYCKCNLSKGTKSMEEYLQYLNNIKNGSSKGALSSYNNCTQ